MSDSLGSLGLDKNRASVQNPIVVLIAVRIPNTDREWIRMTNNTEDIDYGINLADGKPLTYTHYPFTVEGIGQNSNADLEEITLTIEKPRAVLLEEIFEYEFLLDQPFEYVELQACPPYDPAASRAITGKVMHGRMKNGDVIFTLGNPGLAQAPFPAHGYSSIGCDVDYFGDHRCGYKLVSGATNAIGGGFDFCGGTHSDCTIRGKDEAARAVEVLHPKWFGAQPGILRGNSQ